MTYNQPLKQVLLDRLKRESRVNVVHIGATANAGVVTLMGHVKRLTVRPGAERRGSKRAEGVETVIEEPEVRRDEPNALDISDSIMVALRRSWFTPKAINVTAEGGTVRLTGTLDTWVARHLAGSTALAAPGATSVENNIRVD